MRREINGAKILLILRNRIADNWAGLCREFGLNPSVYHTGHSILRHHLDDLQEAGLIEFDTDESPDSRFFRDRGVEGIIRLSSKWESIQTALGISLTEIAGLQPSETMIVRPFFGLPSKPSTKMDVFVLMPFAAELRPIYDDHIKNVTQKLGLTVARADDFFTVHSVMTDVWSAICEARYIIADCTGRNPNVFYEIGLAHMLGKQVILTTQKSDDVPFDLRHIRYIEYQYTPRGMTEFEARLAETLGVVSSC